MMKYAFFSLSLILLLSACTGTREDINPRLLVIGYGDDDGRLALVEDTRLTANEVVDRFVLVDLPSETETLPAPLISYDITDRYDSRRELVVLSRRNEGGENESYINFYNLEDLRLRRTDSATLVENFAPQPPSGAPRFRETELILSSDVDVSQVSEDPLLFCPKDVQISANGRYLALLNQLSLCDATLSPRGAVDVIDLNAEGGPSLLRRFDTFVRPETFLIFQARGGGDDILYYLEEATDTRLRAFDLPSLDERRFNTPVDIPVTDSNPVVDLGVVQDKLIALERNRFFFIEAFTSASATLSEAVTTGPASQALIENNVLDSEDVIILGNSQLTVHLSVTDTEERDANLNAVAGTVEPTVDFAYFIRESSTPLVVLDLRSLDDVEGDIDLTPSTFSESFPNPVFITWALADVEVPAP